jgi:hypothetical protein
MLLLNRFSVVLILHVMFCHVSNFNSTRVLISLEKVLGAGELPDTFIFCEGRGTE